jgi:hypothetical protein
VNQAGYSQLQQQEAAVQLASALQASLARRAPIVSLRTELCYASQNAQDKLTACVKHVANWDKRVDAKDSVGTGDQSPKEM